MLWWFNKPRQTSANYPRQSPKPDYCRRCFVPRIPFCLPEILSACDIHPVLGWGEFYHFQTVGGALAAGQRTVETFYFCRHWRCLVIGNICFFDRRHLTFQSSHDTTFKEGTKALISVNFTPSGQFWRPFWYEWAFSSTIETMSTIRTIVFDDKLLWIIAFHVLGLGVALVVFWLPDYLITQTAIIALPWGDYFMRV